ncbi:NAD(+) diphosphatase [Arthrobacter roseus]|uniref:NAD(+) diphosphatase n=1 Tax=Arthrobacter roseus TaxID=136274 RepID=UPI0019656ECC|nr:NAD(+) diphosphatase [Arthrobacter roseus]MBM7849153.1 NAD+ diphosphatase [Arthrobacter roseus]
MSTLSLSSHPSPLGTLSLSHVALDRGCERRGRSGWLDSIRLLENTRVLLIDGDAAPVRDDSLVLLTPPEVAALFDGHSFQSRAEIYLGRTLGHGCREAGLEVVLAVLPVGLRPALGSEAEEADVVWSGLRQGAHVLDASDAALLVEAVAVANWHATHTHCPRCGTATAVEGSGWVRRCPQDNSQHFPRTDPAIIVTVVDEKDRLLLGSGTNWPEGRYSTLAGFVEPGESLEAAVIREIEEESGVLVHSPQYLGSQPWPFPNSLMLGFTATATSTSTKADGVEIRDVRWFTREELAADLRTGVIAVAGGVSIARALIEHWFGGPLPEAPAGV